MITVNDRHKIKYEKDMTIDNLLDRMKYTYNLITVTVDNELVLTENYSTYKLYDKAKVNVFHLAHGG